MKPEEEDEDDDHLASFEWKSTIQLMGMRGVGKENNTVVNKSTGGSSGGNTSGTWNCGICKKAVMMSRRIEHEKVCVAEREKTKKKAEEKEKANKNADYWLLLSKMVVILNMCSSMLIQLTNNLVQ